jgi:predicted PurR-regulated permease PerM
MAQIKNRPTSSPIMAVVAIGAIVLALYFAQQVLIPLFLAALLAFLLATPIRRVEQLGIRRVPAVLLVVAIAFSFIFLLGWVVGRQVYSLGEHFTDYQTEIQNKAKHLRAFSGVFGSRFERIGKEIETASAATTKPAAAAIPAVPAQSSDGTIPAADGSHLAPGATANNPVYAVVLPSTESPLHVIATYLGLALGPLGTAGVVLIFVIFILLEREDLRDRLIWLISQGNYTLTTQALDDAASRISRYMLAQSIVNGTYGLVVATGLWIIGVTLAPAGHDGFPSFVLWGLLCAVMRFLPYIGPWIAIIFPLAISLAVYPGFQVFIATGALLGAVEVFSVNVMEPWLYGASTGLSTVAIMTAAVFWTWLWGPIGLLLATPITVCMVVLGTHVARLRFLSVMLSDQPALPPSVGFYQRLLAGDRREAESVARAFIAKHGIDLAADRVFIPALRRARRDRSRDLLAPTAEAALLAETEKVITAIAPPSTSTAQSDATQLILCLPAHHLAEELTLKLLRVENSRIQVSSTRLLPAEIESQIERDHPAALFFAVLPPGGLVQARYLCRRLRRRFPQLPIVVGYWGKARNFDRLLVKLRAAGANYVTTSMEQSESQLTTILGATTPIVIAKVLTAPVAGVS